MGGAAFGWPRDRVLWVGFGLFLAGMTLVRPWWFWENYRARWLRGLIGDELTAGLYLMLAATMVWVGWIGRASTHPRIACTDTSCPP